MRHKTPDVGTALMLAFDPRLADVWIAVMRSEFDIEAAGEEFSWFLRMAYLQGYQDALVEPSRGSLFRRLGLPVPKRGSTSVRKAKDDGRSR